MKTVWNHMMMVLGLWWAMAGAVFGQGTAKEQEAKALGVLRSDAAYEAKAEACRDLARTGTAEAVPVLAGLLADEKLGHMARYGLEAIPDPAVDAALREALGKTKGGPLVGVIGSLGARRDAAAVPALVALLKDPDAVVARAAALSLGKIGTADAVGGLQAVLGVSGGAVRWAVCDGLLGCAETALAKGQREAAAKIYDGLRGLPDLPHQLRTAAWRGAVMARAGQEGNALLLEALRSPDAGLVAAGVRIGLESKDAALTVLLTGELAQATPERKVALANVLGKRGDAAAVPALSEVARAGDAGVRVAAIAALAEIGSAQAAGVLLGMIGDAEGQVAQAAATAVSALPGAAVDDAVLAAVAGATDAPTKGKLLEIARQRRIAKAMPVYLAIMQGDDKALRSVAIRCYAELAGEAETAFLLDKLATAATPGDAGEYEKAVMVVMAGREDNAAMVAPLVAVLGKAGAVGKPVALRLLRATGAPAALQAVRAAVDNPDKEVHTAAIRALGEWKSTASAPMLLELAKASTVPVDKILCVRGCLGMAARPQVPAPEKIAMCRSVAPMVERDEERRLLLGVLGSVADAGAMDLVTPCLDQAGVKNEAAATVLAIAAKRPAKQHGAVTKTALEKTVQVCADQPETVKKAQEFLAALGNEKP